MKSHQLQYKVCFDLTLFEKVMNFIMLQHGYHRRIIQQAGGEKHLHRWFIWRDGSDEEHIITTGWWCKAAVMMDYHCRLVRRSGGDSYEPEHSYEPTVIVSSPVVRITNR
jgi:hypothetical protein